MAKKAYLFVHFRETRSPEGEQVHFGISKDGFHWEEVNHGKPVLWSYLGEKGVRDFTITRLQDGRFVILATDLSLAYEFRFKYKNSWQEVGTHGSKNLMMWESKDLIHWEPQRELHLGNEDFGMLWAPDIIYDKNDDSYIVHWSSNHKDQNFQHSCIYYSRTKDFETFSEPKILFKGEAPCIDSAMYEENGKYFLFVKSTKNPCRVQMFESNNITGPFTIKDSFEKAMDGVIDSTYEAPTAFRAEDDRWVLMLDWFGTKNASEQGYIPFLADSMESGDFKRSESSFSFPYGYKHGTALEITMEEYERLKAYEKSPNEF